MSKQSIYLHTWSASVWKTTCSRVGTQQLRGKTITVYRLITARISINTDHTDSTTLIDQPDLITYPGIGFCVCQLVIFVRSSGPFAHFVFRHLGCSEVMWLSVHQSDVVYLTLGSRALCTNHAWPFISCWQWMGGWDDGLIDVPADQCKCEGIITVEHYSVWSLE